MHKIKRILKDVQAISRTHLKEKFLADLRKAREQYKGPDLAKVGYYYLLTKLVVAL